MVRVLVTVALGMLLMVGPLGTAAASNSDATYTIIGCSPEDGDCEHCPTDVHNYVWRPGDWIAECQN